jgi:hypothetical protein
MWFAILFFPYHHNFVKVRESFQHDTDARETDNAEIKALLSRYLEVWDMKFDNL